MWSFKGLYKTNDTENLNTCTASIYLPPSAFSMKCARSCFSLWWRLFMHSFILSFFPPYNLLGEQHFKGLMEIEEILCKSESKYSAEEDNSLLLLTGMWLTMAEWPSPLLLKHMYIYQHMSAHIAFFLSLALLSWLTSIKRIKLILAKE